jgi:hypothetical protein
MVAVPAAAVLPRSVARLDDAAAPNKERDSEVGWERCSTMANSTGGARRKNRWWRRTSLWSSMEDERRRQGTRARENGREREVRGKRSVCIYRDTGEVASMRGAREPRGARNLSLVGHDGMLQFDRSVSFLANSKDTENTIETAHFPILFLQIRLSIDFGARDKIVYLREVNKIALRIQS